MNDRFHAILALIILASSNLCAQWVVKYVDEEGPYIFDLEMHPQGHGLAVGGAGLVLRTEDIGESWIPIASGITDDINQVAFVSAETIVIASHKLEKNGSIYRSLDGGFSWEQVYTYPDFFLSLHFFNDSVGLASGINIILRTSNGGATWVPVYDIPGMTSFKAGVIWMDITGDSVAFAGIQAWENGLNKLSRFLLKSVDSGETWQKVIDFENKISSCDIILYDEWLGFMEFDFNFQRTLDGGMTWDMTDNITGVVGMSMPSDSVFYTINTLIPITGGPDVFAICRSMDSGMTWQGMFQSGAPLRAIHFLNDTVGFVAGDHSIIMKTEHGGGEIIGDYPWELYTGVSQPEGKTINFRIHPNPATDQITIEWTDAGVKEVTLTIMDAISGRAIYYQSLLAPFVHTLDISSWPAGMYIYQFSDGRESIAVGKLIVE